jgi:hypothetical protein
MADCTKRILDLNPFDAVECFFQADAWQVIGQNFRRIWIDLSSLTIGEWLAYILVAALAPAVVASYILPLIFIYKLIRRYALKTPPVLHGREHTPKNFWGGYLLLSGIVLIVLVALYPHEQFLFWQGSWQAICGSRSSYWGRLGGLRSNNYRTQRLESGGSLAAPRSSSSSLCG